MKIKNIYLVALFVSFVLSINYAQQLERPKLIVGIVVDQMRFDYLYKYYSLYGMGGFKRLINEGSNFTFAHFNYEATKTAPGHASIYTGTVPFYHGIVGNDWYDKQSKASVNAVVDTNYNSIGSDDKEGECSPKRLLSTTITDQLKLATGGKSKVISISFKNRGAVLPGGHMPDGVYWYNNNNGDFITSSFYMKQLPRWVSDFNKRKLADKFIASGWHLLLPKKKYSISEPDESPFEEDVFNEGKTSFPHTFDNLKQKDKYSRISTTPWGNELVYQMAINALVNENLGKDEYTDFLALSFSSTDYVGHSYGTNAYETQDIYLRLDATLAEFLTTLDNTIGKNKYLLFLTADHAGLDTPSYLREENIPVGALGNNNFNSAVTDFVLKTFGSDKLIENFSNKQIYFNREEIKSKGVDINQLQQKTANFIRDNFAAVASIFTRDNLEGKTATREPINMLLNSYPLSIGGDIFFTLHSGYLPSFREKGTNHGTEFTYDTHVPLLFYGWKIPKSTINTPVYIVDIAPTIADLIKITQPSASIGIPLIK